jgi:hypothetical protein
MRNEKPFDAVRLMREIRDRTSREFAGMTFEEQKKRMEEVLGKNEPVPQRIDAREPATPSPCDPAFEPSGARRNIG